MEGKGNCRERGDNSRFSTYDPSPSINSDFDFQKIFLVLKLPLRVIE